MVDVIQIQIINYLTCQSSNIQRLGYDQFICITGFYGRTYVCEKDIILHLCNQQRKPGVRI